MKMENVRKYNWIGIISRNYLRLLSDKELSKLEAKAEAEDIDNIADEILGRKLIRLKWVARMVYN